LIADPTATHVGPEHDTACSDDALVPVGAGTWRTVSELPSQRPKSSPVGVVKMLLPDKAHDDVVTHEIRVRVIPGLRVMDLVDTTDPSPFVVTSTRSLSLVFWPAATHPAPWAQLTE
jgi:hypothetical protein